MMLKVIVVSPPVVKGTHSPLLLIHFLTSKTFRFNHYFVPFTHLLLPTSHIISYRSLSNTTDTATNSCFRKVVAWEVWDTLMAVCNCFNKRAPRHYRNHHQVKQKIHSYPSTTLTYPSTLSMQTIKTYPYTLTAPTINTRC